MDFHAFVNKDINVEPLNSGSLSGLTFAVKDVFAIKGVISSAGHPDWLRTHQPAKEHAPVITSLLQQGAKLTGTTVTDELMYSLQGENVHYGTPVNPRAPQCIPGGSSSGSAVAVSAKLADFTLGTDTGGSVRIPAAYCGNYGFRPTHGAVSIERVIPLAPNFDTVGWFTQSSHTLLEVGTVLLGNHHQSSSKTFNQLIIAEDAWDLADTKIKASLLPFVSSVEKKVESFQIKLAEEGLTAWMETFRILQGIEIWKTHGEWIEEVNPTFGPGVAERFQMAKNLKEEESGPQQELREKIRKQITDILSTNRLLVIPTVPGKAPLLNQPNKDVQLLRENTLKLSCIAGLAGLPQVTIPVTNVDGVPVALSFIAGANQDLSLMQWVHRMENVINNNQT